LRLLAMSPCFFLSSWDPPTPRTDHSLVGSETDRFLLWNADLWFNAYAR